MTFKRINNVVFIKGWVFVPGSIAELPLKEASNIYNGDDEFNTLVYNHNKRVIESAVKNNEKIIIMYPVVNNIDFNLDFEYGTLCSIMLNESRTEASGDVRLYVKGEGLVEWLFDKEGNKLQDLYLQANKNRLHHKNVDIDDYDLNDFGKEMITPLIEKELNEMNFKRHTADEELGGENLSRLLIEFSKGLVDVIHAETFNKVLELSLLLEFKEIQVDEAISILMEVFEFNTKEMFKVLLQKNPKDRYNQVENIVIELIDIAELSGYKSYNLDDKGKDEYKDLRFIGLTDADKKLSIKHYEGLGVSEDKITRDMVESFLLRYYKEKENFHNQVNEKLNKRQKEVYARLLIEELSSELGEGGDGLLDKIEEVSKSISFPKHVEERFKRDFSRAKTLERSSQEFSVAIDSLKLMTSLPWDISSSDNEDLRLARKILDESHHSMQEVKERIVEYLAVKKMTKSMAAPILCLVGPPGVGKTSIAKSIAKAAGKKFVKMSLGGISDESEIRGHRSTYVGAKSGKIIDALKRAGTNNPLILLDEIDKLGKGASGDPSSALLEVLDPEQNAHFLDTYLDEEFDLSNVMFVATANHAADIPDPLYDRMEVIYLSSYTALEKLDIAKNYLVKRKAQEIGLKENQVEISDDAIMKIIEGHTMESGVRQLEREISKVLRKSLLAMLENDEDKISIKKDDIERLLGKDKLFSNKKEDEDRVGCVAGLSVSSYGGSLLFIEATKVKGRGNVNITGNLGEVIEESAMVAHAYVNSRAEELSIDQDLFNEYDIHIHLPEGAIPKDGPSAGIALTTAIVSLMKDKKVSRDVAMTGEISLRGRVMPVGGVKEKLIAAHRAGIKKAIIPFDNGRDLKEIPDIVKKEMDIILVKTIDEVIKEALV